MQYWRSTAEDVPIKLKLLYPSIQPGQNTGGKVMNTQRQKTNWLIDVALFAGFLICFLSDLTGFSVHQWLGVAVGLLAGYHLVLHWAWVKAVSLRFFQHIAGQTRLYYAVDAGVMLSFLAIMVTGLVISTWLALPMENYYLWKNVHVLASVITLLLVVLKMGAHWRWVVTVANRYVFVHNKPAGKAYLPPPASAARSMDRREFLKLMGMVGVASALAIAGARGSIRDALITESTPESPATDSSLTQTVGAGLEQTAGTGLEQAAGAGDTDSKATSNCVVRCSRGCSYPGQCRRYTDANRNGRCDLGECLA